MKNTTMENTKNKNEVASNDFIVGLVTFIIFILFMTAWMYFST